MKPIARHPLTPHLLARAAPAFVLLGAGCAAITSSGPVGPLRPGNTTQLTAAWAYAYGPATATVSGYTVQGNGQTQTTEGGASLPSPLPATVGFRQALGDRAEVSVEVGQMDSGMRLRVGLSDGPTAPSAISFEGRSGEIAFAPVGSYQGSAAFEIYPDITPPQTHRQVRLILSLGIVDGVFEHQLTLPFSFNIADDIGAGPWMTVLRPELRLQGAIGVYLGGGKYDGTSITVAPWFLLSAGTPTATCGGCGPEGSTAFSFSSYSQTWGAALIITPSHGWFHVL